MGTRADFYIGEQMEWLGSIAWDGYPEGLPGLESVDDGDGFRGFVDALLERDDGTSPEQGWPWPWEDSGTTDYAYLWRDGQLWVGCYGSGWVTLDDARRRMDWEKLPTITFPDMSERRSVTFGKRSGLLVISIPDDDA